MSSSSCTAFLAHARFSAGMWLPMQSYCAGQMPFMSGSSSPVVSTLRRRGSRVCSRQTRRHSGRRSLPETRWATCALAGGASSLSKRSGSTSRSQLGSYVVHAVEAVEGASERGEEGYCAGDGTVSSAGPWVSGVQLCEWPTRAAPPCPSQDLEAAPPPSWPLPLPFALPRRPLPFLCGGLFAGLESSLLSSRRH